MCNKKVKISIYGEIEIVSFNKLCVLIDIYGANNVEIIDEE